MGILLSSFTIKKNQKQKFPVHDISRMLRRNRMFPHYMIHIIQSMGNLDNNAKLSIRDFDKMRIYFSI